MGPDSDPELREGSGWGRRVGERSRGDREGQQGRGVGKEGEQGRGQESCPQLRSCFLCLGRSVHVNARGDRLTALLRDLLCGRPEDKTALAVLAYLPR